MASKLSARCGNYVCSTAAHAVYGRGRQNLPTCLVIGVVRRLVSRPDPATRQHITTLSGPVARRPAQCQSLVLLRSCLAAGGHAFSGSRRLICTWARAASNPHSWCHCFCTVEALYRGSHGYSPHGPLRQCQWVQPVSCRPKLSGETQRTLMYVNEPLIPWQGKQETDRMRK
jgi:hypothetical protein